METEKIKSLINLLSELLESKHLEEIEVEEGELRLRVRRGGGAPASTAAPWAPAAPAATPEPEEDLFIIKSPIVGTFYTSSSPGGPEFVKVGERVEAGQVLCIIEAMKLMNEIEAEVAGEIVRRMVTNGQPVEFGEALFAIRPAGASAQH